MEMLILAGHQTAVIDDVRSEGGADAVEFLGARLGLPGRKNDFHQSMTGYPPRAVPARLQAPAIGTALDSDETYMLILGYRVLAGEVARRTSITIDYTSGGRPYTVSFPAQLVICPAPVSDDECAEAYPP